MTVDFEITNLLHGLGVSSKLKGFGYLLDILSNIINENIKTFKMNDLYNMLAERYNSNINTIAKCIKEAIEKSWNNGSVDLIEKIFSYSIGYDNECPSNSLFVNTIVDYLKTCN